MVEKKSRANAVRAAHRRARERARAGLGDLPRGLPRSLRSAQVHR
jgi:hypothetical protein